MYKLTQANELEQLAQCMKHWPETRVQPAKTPYLRGRCESL